MIGCSELRPCGLQVSFHHSTVTAQLTLTSVKVCLSVIAFVLLNSSVQTLFRIIVKTNFHAVYIFITGIWLCSWY